MKNLPIYCLLLIVWLLLGTTILYNSEITGIRLTVLMQICNKNDGIKTLRRSFINPEKFVIQCNDTAIFNDVSFILQKEKEPQS